MTDSDTHDSLSILKIGHSFVKIRRNLEKRGGKGQTEGVREKEIEKEIKTNKIRLNKNVAQRFP